MKRFRIPVVSLLLAGAVAAAGSPAGEETDARARSDGYQQKAVEAYQKKDWPGFLENARKAEELLPGNPRLLYNLACAEALNGHPLAVRHGEILDMNDPEFDEPTLGVVVGNDFYFVARSQWGSFDEKAGAFRAEKLKAPTILRVALRR